MPETIASLSLLAVLLITILSILVKRRLAHRSPDVTYRLVCRVCHREITSAMHSPFWCSEDCRDRDPEISNQQSQIRNLKSCNP